MEPVNQKGNGRGYEASDASLKSVIMLVALTAGLVLVGVISMWALFGFIVDHYESQDVPPSPLAGTRAPFTGPRLQVSPPLDMKEMKAAEQEILESYDWVDQEAGIVRIPIERAIDLISERGLPTASASEQEQ
jgi:hypothetical protein